MPDSAAPLSSPRYWPLRLGLALYRLTTLLPWGPLMALGRGLGRLSQRLAPRRAGIARINLGLCFPELDAGAREALLRRHFESMGMGLMDMGLAWWASEERLAPWLRVQGTEHARAALSRGRGAIFLTAHFTSIEMSGRALRGLGPMHPVYRPHQSPAIEAFVRAQREHHTETAIPRDDVRLLLRTLKEGKGIWFAPDQNFGHKGSLFSPFFGIPAATNTATARLARLSGAPVVPVVAFRREDTPGWDVYIGPALADFPSDDLQRDTDRINALMETWVRRAPAQYLWSHRRFKDRPAGEERFY
jgi:Kdo2-lipid IVA lauroyltransferase/acyltransferase